MLRHGHLLAIARLPAVLVAIALSGAPRVVALHAPAERHLCSCQAKAGERHDCTCAICRKAALVAQASDQDLPPCHRAAAREALSATGRGESRSVPCVEGTCGNPGRSPPTVAGGEPFHLPRPAAVTLRLSPEWRPPFAPPSRWRPSEPETPPPRAA